MAKPTGERFDHWIDSYAKRAGSLSVSEVRALFAVVSRPEVVSLAGGMPNVSSLPKELITESFAKLMSTKGDMALQYGVTGIPMMAVFQGGTIAKQMVGARPKTAIVEDLAAFLA